MCSVTLAFGVIRSIMVYGIICCHNWQTCFMKNNRRFGATLYGGERIYGMMYGCPVVSMMWSFAALFFFLTTCIAKSLVLGKSFGAVSRR